MSAENSSFGNNSANGVVSLLDLRKQIAQFNIDEDLINQICFGESLVISCCHGDYEDDEDSESSFTCDDSTISKSTEEESKPEEVEPEHKKEPEEQHKEEDLESDEDDFHFFFYDDLVKRPPPIDDDASILIMDGIPQINPRKRKGACLCASDGALEVKCTCHDKICRCGAEETFLCTCGAATQICLCHPDDEPRPLCTCKKGEVCLCHPDGMPRPVCTCGKTIPCVCHPEGLKKIQPVCTCGKPHPCLCHTSEEPTACVCGKSGDDCICHKKRARQATCVCGNPDVCFCGSGGNMRPVCTCENPDACVCNYEEDHKIMPLCTCGYPQACICFSDKRLRPICACGQPDACVCYSDGHLRRVCTCGHPEACTCYSNEKMRPHCTCGHPEACICFSDGIMRKVCTCSNPNACICYSDEEVRRVCTCGNPDACLCRDDKVLEKCTCTSWPCTCHKGGVRNECVCDESEPTSEEEVPPICICPPGGKKIRRKRKKKSKGYHRCYETDPKHTFFDYAYDRHGKVKPVLKEKESSKVNILNEIMPKKKKHICVVTSQGELIAKKFKKFSLDCCTATGGMSINVEALGRNKDRLLVMVSTEFSKEGAKTSTRLVSIVDSHLHTLEEKRTESITKKTITKQRKHYMAICKQGYYNKLTRRCGDKEKVSRIYHGFATAHDFLLEGASILLLRYMAIQKFKGVVKAKTVLVDGSLCETTYVSHGVSQSIVNGKPMFVVKVDRQIVENCGIVHLVHSTLTLKGYLVSHEWEGCNYVIHINPLLRIKPETDDIELHAPLRERWQHDLQLLSSYLDFKNVRKSDGDNYLAEHPELYELAADYLQAILALRPRDVLRFTRHYFGTHLGALDLPLNDFFEPSSKHVRYYYLED